MLDGVRAAKPWGIVVPNADCCCGSMGGNAQGILVGTEHPRFPFCAIAGIAWLMLKYFCCLKDHVMKCLYCLFGVLGLDGLGID